MHHEVGDYNRLLVLKTIRRRGPISRSELATAIGLAGATITELTGSLVRRGLITQTRQNPKGMGRPRTLLEVNASAAVVLGASISTRGMLATSFTDLAGNRLLGTEAQIGLNRSIADFAANLADLLLQMIRGAPCAKSDISMVALALPGIIDSVHGIVHSIPTMPDVSTPLAAIISKKLRLPVVVGNEVDGLARAEHWFGQRAVRDDFSVVYLGLHIGMGSYADGWPRVATNGINPEFGHVKTSLGKDARLCICGARGCLTTHGLIGSVADSFRRHMEDGRPFKVDLLEIYNNVIHSALTGDARSLAIIEETGTHLGIALANYINSDNPGYILILTESPGLPDLLRAPLNRALETHTLRPILSRTTITFDVVDSDWRLRGAAALALEKSYSDNRKLPVRRIRRARQAR
jgi:transcriptional regulator of PTS gene